MEKLIVKVREFIGFGNDVDVDSRIYDSKGEPVIFEGQVLGQVSSSLSWAKQDIPNNNGERLDEIYPKGWEIVDYEVEPLGTIQREVSITLSDHEFNSPNPIILTVNVSNYDNPKSIYGLIYTIPLYKNK